jgi:hypothetical protein
MILAMWGWAVVAAWRRRDRSVPEVLLVPGGLLALGVLAVSAQGKFWPYHWGVEVAFLALAGAHGLAECGRRFPRLVPWVAAGAVLIGFLLGPERQRTRAEKDPRPTTYLRLTAGTWRYILGRIPRADFLDPFDGGYRYYYADEEALGLAIRQRARAGDRLLVDGFEPAIYAASGLRSPSRFFFTIFLDDLSFPFPREAWIEEHRQAVAADRPRFAVTDEKQADQIRDLETQGFRRIMQRGWLVLFERNPMEGTGSLP